jgi:hypothetical protein
VAKRPTTLLTDGTLNDTKSEPGFPAVCELHINVNKHRRISAKANDYDFILIIIDFKYLDGR